MTVVMIHSPSDFRGCLGFQDFAVWDLSHLASDQGEQALAEVSQLFQDLSSLEAGETAQEEEFLEGVRTPLGILRTHDGGILAIISRGVMRLDGGGEMPEWVRAHFLIVPLRGAFQAGDDSSGAVHRFDTRCNGGMDLLKDAVREGRAIRSWENDRRLEIEFLEPIPWCRRCLELSTTIDQ